jgi:hypothetical protein
MFVIIGGVGTGKFVAKVKVVLINLCSNTRGGFGFAKIASSTDHNGIFFAVESLDNSRTSSRDEGGSEGSLHKNKNANNSCRKLLGNNEPAR